MKATTLAIAIAASAAFIACSDEDPAELVLADRVEVQSGSNQVAGQSSALAAPVVVRVVDAGGAPMAGLPVEWRVLEGGGALLSADSITNEQGLATATWELGLGTGQNLLLAAAGGVTVTIRATSERRFVEVSASLRHSCAISSIGQAFCWGDNETGQLGDGTLTPRTTPVAVQTGLRFRAISAGYGFTCGIDLDDAVYCWGDNREGQLGTAGPSTRLPTRMTGTRTFKMVSAGFIHACGVTEAGEAYCWGSNGTGRLGTGDRISSSVPVRVVGNRIFSSISAGEFHSCAVTTDQAAFCWGWNSTGELGSGSAYGAFVEAPIQVVDAARYTNIAAGSRHTCAIATDSAVWCWGRSGAGEIGTPVFLNSNVPVALPGGLRFEAIGAGNVNSCGIGGAAIGGSRDALAVYCWGSDGFNNHLAPTSIFAGPDRLAVGHDHVCAVKQGVLWCWGTNTHGQLGTGNATGSAAPVKVQVPAT